MGDMTMDELRGWFAGRIPDEWFTRPAGRHRGSRGDPRRRARSRT